MAHPTKKNKGTKEKDITETAKEYSEPKGKSGGDPHGRTKKEKVKDFVKGVGLTSKQKKARDFAKGGLALTTGLTGSIGKIVSKAPSIVKKVMAKENQPSQLIKKIIKKPKSDLKSTGTRKGYPHE